ncbi:MAG: transglycosylase SLT domain-containing protein [Muribaculum sp.]|nr:transglycosylase SLT domain-containing protein [Muribaculum sp.]
MRRLLGYPIIALILCVAMAACGGKKKSSHQAEMELKKLPDTLKVGTLYSALSYFIYRGEPMGYDYDLVEQFGTDKGIAIDIVVAHSLPSLLAMLDSGTIDLAAYEIPITAEYRDRVIPAGPENITTQVLVQPKSSDSSIVRDVTDLIGREVYVEKGSKYEYRLENLNEELGGGIKIHTVDQDTLITEDMIEMVSTGQIPMTIVDSDIAKINKTYYNALDITMDVSYPQRSSWGVSPKTPWLADTINAWIKTAEYQRENELLFKRYFELSKAPYSGDLKISNGRMSKYDELFKKYADQIGWDWRLLASQGFAESRFNPNAVSWAGARGVMQIMPRTANAYGLSRNNMANPEASIRTATKIIQDLDKQLKKRVPDDNERKKFVLAAYNTGLAHVLDAIALAKKYGKDPTVWSGNVAETMLWKSNPKYYNDPVVKYGYSRGGETTSYVKKIMNYYDQSRRQIPA